MRIDRRPALALVAAAALLALAACTSPASPATSKPAAAGAVSPAASPSAAGAAAAGADVCALVPADALKAAIGGHPGAGRPAKGKIDGGQCTWKVSSTHTALIQFTREPGAYLPASIYTKPRKAVALHGVDHGWASPATHTIYIVKRRTGVLFTDIGFTDVNRHAFVVLGKAIAARL